MKKIFLIYLIQFYCFSVFSSEKNNFNNMENDYSWISSGLNSKKLVIESESDKDIKTHIKEILDSLTIESKLEFSNGNKLCRIRFLKNDGKLSESFFCELINDNNNEEGKLAVIKDKKINNFFNKTFKNENLNYEKLKTFFVKYSDFPCNDFCNDYNEVHNNLGKRYNLINIFEGNIEFKNKINLTFNQILIEPVDLSLTAAIGLVKAKVDWTDFGEINIHDVDSMYERQNILFNNFDFIYNEISNINNKINQINENSDIKFSINQIEESLKKIKEEITDNISVEINKNLTNFKDSILNDFISVIKEKNNELSIEINKNFESKFFEFISTILKNQTLIMENFVKFEKNIEEKNIEGKILIESTAQNISNLSIELSQLKTEISNFIKEQTNIDEKFLNNKNDLILCLSDEIKLIKKEIEDSLKLTDNSISLKINKFSSKIMKQNLNLINFSSNFFCPTIQKNIKKLKDLIFSDTSPSLHFYIESIYNVFFEESTKNFNFCINDEINKNIKNIYELFNEKILPYKNKIILVESISKILGINLNFENKEFYNYINNLKFSENLRGLYPQIKSLYDLLKDAYHKIIEEKDKEKKENIIFEFKHNFDFIFEGKFRNESSDYNIFNEGNYPANLLKKLEKFISELEKCIFS